MRAAGCPSLHPCSPSRVHLGNFGDAHAVGGGIWELRIDYGSGYRVYYAQEWSRDASLALWG
jgi:putative addiction module killer protein